MSLDKQRAEDPLASRADLLEYFRSAEKPAAQHRVGLEHEKLLFGPDGGPVPYEGRAGVGALFGGLLHYGYAPFHDAPDRPAIALERGQSTVSLEPGGQFELSGAPARTAREAHAENLVHLMELCAQAGPLGIRAAALGYRPFGTVDQMPWMPKLRYDVMRPSLGRRGRLALDMMLMTATGQVSLDWESEEDCSRKASAAARVAPLVVALFANSPVAQGRPTGFMSYRSRVWSEVDPARCGYLPSQIEGGFGYDAYVEWALDAPLLFLRREGEYLQPRLTFRELLERGYEGRPARRGDWADHLSTLFPEVRLKRVMEIRGMDSVGPQMTAGLLALYRGLLYEPVALDEALALLPRLRFPEHLELHDAARRDGLRARFRGAEVARLAAELVEIARRGLARLDPADAPLLDALSEVARSGRCPAEAVLEALPRGPAAVIDVGALDKLPCCNPALGRS